MRIHMMTFSVYFRHGRRDEPAFWSHASEAIRTELEKMIEEYTKDKDPHLEYPTKVYIHIGNSDVHFENWLGEVVHVTQLSEATESSNHTLNRLQTLMNDEEKKGDVKLGWKTQIAFISENIEKRGEDPRNNAESHLLRLRLLKLRAFIKQIWA